MWALILGLVCVLPWLIIQCTKVKLEKETFWNITTTILAVIGVIAITLGV